MVENIANPTAPIPLAILLCDSVITDEITKKKSLIGIFDRINVQTFPASHKPLTIYARFIDAEGDYIFRIEYVQIKDDKILSQAVSPALTISDRLKPFDLLLTPPPIQIPEPGQYEFRIWANDRYVGRASFIAEQIKGS